MSKPKSAATVECYFCDQHHLHVEMKNERDDVIADIALNFDDGMDMIQNLLCQIEEMTGLTFVLLDDDDDNDSIGPVMGHA